MIFVSSATLIAANGLYLLTIIADTASDLPAGDTVQVGNVVYDIAPGSTGIATDTGKKYMRTPSGTWAEQPEIGDITINLPDVYSEDEVDALLAPITDDIDDIQALVNDIQTLDTKQTLALVHLINENGKNKVKPTATTQEVNGITWTVNADGTITASGTATANSYITVQVLPADSVFDGNYFLTGCPSGGSASKYALYVARGNYTKYDYGDGVVLSSNTDGLNKNLIAIVYSGQTVTNLVFQPMICKKVYWDITNKFVPYCPTLPELYAMMQ